MNSQEKNSAGRMGCVRRIKAASLSGLQTSLLAGAGTKCRGSVAGTQKIRLRVLRIFKAVVFSGLEE
jgi:hypothetical protein